MAILGKMSMVLSGLLLISVSLSHAATGQVFELPGGGWYEIYVVKKGDTVWKIAERRLANPEHWKNILVPDRFVSTNPNLIYPGQLLLVPTTEEPVGRIIEVERASCDQQTQTEQAPEKTWRTIRAVAVARFKNNGDGQYDWLATGLAETLSADMTKIPGVKNIGRGLIEEMLQERKLSESGIIDASQAKDIGKKVDADHVISGWYRVQAGNVEIEANLLDAEKDAVVETALVSGRMDRIFELERLLLLKLFEKSVNLTDEVRANVLGGDRTSLDAFEQSSKGKSLFYLRRQVRRSPGILPKSAHHRPPRYKAALADLKSSVSQGDTLAIMPFKNAGGRAGDRVNQELALHGEPAGRRCGRCCRRFAGENKGKKGSETA